MEPIKFRCEITELIDAVKKHCNIDNVVIENGEDIDNAVKNLMQAIGLSAVYPRSCKFQGESAIIELSFYSGAHVERCCEEVKKLQRCISSEKER